MALMKTRQPMTVLLLAVFILPLVAAVSRLSLLSSVDDYLNICLDGRNHKSKPGPEDTLFQHCLPWRKRSCCTSSVSHDLHLSNKWLNFDWNHCGFLSPQCRRHFLQDLCFYECSPNTGPWLVEDRRKHRSERFVDMPLCTSECSSWWEDCKDETTCLEDWSKGFNWTSGINTCPKNKACRPFHEIYTDSTHFCESIWGRSWKVMPEGEPCIYLWFDADIQNPNDDIARKRAEALVGTATQLHLSSLVTMVTLCLLAFQCLHNV